MGDFGGGTIGDPHMGTMAGGNIGDFRGGHYGTTGDPHMGTVWGRSTIRDITGGGTQNRDNMGGAL